MMPDQEKLLMPQDQQEASMPAQQTLAEPTELMLFQEKIADLANQQLNLSHQARKDGIIQGSSWPLFGSCKGQPFVGKMINAEILEKLDLSQEYFWFRGDELRLTAPSSRLSRVCPSDDEREEEQQWIYARIITVDSFCQDFCKTMKKISTTASSFVGFISFQGNMWYAFSHDDGPLATRDVHAEKALIVTLIYSFALLFRAVGACRTALRFLRPDPRTGKLYDEDIAQPPSLTMHAAVALLHFVNAPKVLAYAPVVLHIRKAGQAFAIWKLNKRRIWILGYVSEAQYHFEHSPSQFWHYVQIIAETFLLVLEILYTYHTVAGKGAMIIPCLISFIAVLGHFGDMFFMCRELKWRDAYRLDLHQCIDDLNVKMQAIKCLADTLETWEQQEDLKRRRDVAARALKEVFDEVAR